MARHPDSGRNYLSTIYHQRSPQPVGHQRGVDRFQAEARHIKGTIVCTKMGLARHVGNEGTWHRYVDVETHRHQDTGASKALAEGQVKAKAKAKGKKRTLETCMCCGKERQKKADCKFKTATCSSCGKVGHLRAVCRITNSHEIEKVADEPIPEVTVEEVWCMAVQDTLNDGHCDCTEKHDVISEYSEESKFQEFPEYGDGSKFWKSQHEHRDGSKF